MARQEHIPEAFTRPLRALAIATQALLIVTALGHVQKRPAALAAVAAAAEGVLSMGFMWGSVDTLRTVAASAKAEGAERLLVAAVKSEPLIDVGTIPKLPPVEPPHIPGLGKPPVFKEALADMVTRVPTVLQPEAARTAAAISDLYATEHAFAVAKSADLAVTKRVQKLVAEGILEGKTTSEQVGKIMQETGDWTRGYAETVYRTNLNTAQVSGRFRQMKTRVARIVTPALIFQATGSGTAKDPRTRMNHWLAHGAVAPPEHPMWSVIRPPLGYNCRCTVHPVTWRRLHRMGLVEPDGSIKVRAPKPGAGPDEGFRTAAIPR